MTTTARFKLAVGAAALLLLSSCADRDRHGRVLDTTTAGTVNISADETLRPLIETELETFHALYPKAHVNVHYLPQDEAIQKFIRDTMRLVITSRSLDEQEMKYFKSLKLPMRNTVAAYDAIAIIVNKANKDSVLSLQQLGRIFKGEVKNWSDLDKSYSAKPIRVVFDNTNSSTFGYMREYFKTGNTIPDNFYALKTNPEVIDYVEKNPEAMGIIGVSWISNKRDSSTVKFLDKIKVMALSPPDTAKNTDQAYYQPYQAYIALRHYPLVRTISINSRELWAGLGTGFASFMAGDKGQMIAYWQGLVPAQMQIRLVSVKKELTY